MNHLAQLAHRLVTGEEAADELSLTAAQQTAVKSIGTAVSQAPKALAALLSAGDTPPIDWMIPPSRVALANEAMN